MGSELDRSWLWRLGRAMLAGFLLGSYGHVPNGARVYYLQRSQPPLLTLMMDRYMTHTNDIAFLRWGPPPCASLQPPHLRPPRVGLGRCARAEVVPGSTPGTILGP